jgi:hypothetical protein
VALFRRNKHRPGTTRAADSSDVAHLAKFASSHSGVEAFIEPRTTVTETTIVLVAASGEWTRRRINGAEGARTFARKHKVPLYDAGVTGYPPRMRDWTARRKANGDTGPPGVSGPSV